MVAGLSGNCSGPLVEISTGLRKLYWVVLFVTLLPLRDTPLALLQFLSVSFSFDREITTHMEFKSELVSIKERRERFEPSMLEIPS